MARVAAERSSSFAGVYEAVRQRIEADAAVHASWIAGWPEEGQRRCPYPLQRVLDALRAGKQIDVGIAWVPAEFRPPREVWDMFDRVLITPEGLVGFVGSDFETWEREAGL